MDSPTYAYLLNDPWEIVCKIVKKYSPFYQLYSYGRSVFLEDQLGGDVQLIFSEMGADASKG